MLAGCRQAEEGIASRGNNDDDGGGSASCDSAGDGKGDHHDHHSHRGRRCSQTTTSPEARAWPASEEPFAARARTCARANSRGLTRSHYHYREPHQHCRSRPLRYARHCVCGVDHCC